jgi:hypothetical protein
MSKELETKKSESALALAEAQDMNAWGGTEISSNDIIIPRILLMQPMSEKVTAGEAAFGDFRESLNNEKLGDFAKGFEFLPFYMEKVFIEYDASDAEDKKYIRVVPITPANEDLKYEDVGTNRDGEKVPISRDRVMNFYVLLPTELEVGGAIPYIISARRTSIKAGKKLAMQMFVKNAAAGKTPASVICNASCGKQSQDKKTWAVLDVTPARPTPDAYLVEALKWLKMVKAGKAKAHEESYDADSREVLSTEPAEAVDINATSRF